MRPGMPLCLPHSETVVLAGRTVLRDRAPGIVRSSLALRRAVPMVGLRIVSIGAVHRFSPGPKVSIQPRKSRAE